MSYNLVLDASTLILLAKIELLAVVLKGNRVAVTAEVEAEATGRQELLDAKMIAEAVRAHKMDVRRVDSKRAQHIATDFSLGTGEASSVVLAKEYRAVLGTDDKSAIKVCRVLDIRFTTALHLLIGAYTHKHLDRPLALVKLEKLQRYGRYSARILEDAIKGLQGGELS